MEEPLHWQSCFVLDWQDVLSLPRRGFSLRPSRVFTRCISADGPANDRDGVRFRDGDQGDSVPDEGDRGGDDAQPGWTFAAAALAALSRWVEAFAFYAAVQPELAVSYSGAFDHASGAGLSYYMALKVPGALERLQVLKAQYDEAWELAAAEDHEKAAVRFVPRRMYIGGGYS